MEVISLVDNRRRPQSANLGSEPGLSMCIITNGQRILFDTGCSGLFSTNAQILNVEIAQLSLAVISHHHFDHGGGLAALLKENPQAGIFLRESNTEHFYLHFLGLLKRRIGLDESLFQHHPDRFTFIHEFSEIAPWVFILTSISKRYPMPKGNRHLYIHADHTQRLDDFEHELVLVVQENRQLVVFTGCSHHGILNMIESVLDQFPGHTIKAVFGGFHLIDSPLLYNLAGSRKEVEELGEALLRYPVLKFYTGHCTGIQAYRLLKKVMGSKLEYFSTGDRVEV